MEKENEGGERGELPPPPPPPPRQTRPPPPHPDVGTRTGQGAEPSGAGRGEEKTAPAAREHEPADRLEALGAGRRRGGEAGRAHSPRTTPPTPHGRRSPRGRDTGTHGLLPPTSVRIPGGARVGARTPRRPAGRRRSGHPRARRTGGKESRGTGPGRPSRPHAARSHPRGGKRKRSAGRAPPERPLTAREARSGEGLHLRKTPKSLRG